MYPQVKKKKYWRKPKILSLVIADVTLHEIDGTNDDLDRGLS